MAGIPDAVRALAELTPVEDLLLAVLREGLPGVSVKSLIDLHQTFPLVLVRRDSQFGDWDGDERFVDSADIVLHTFAEDPNGDEDSAILAEAVRIVLRNGAMHQTVYPELGNLSKVQMTSAPRRVTDWASSTGPVQYADLPAGVWRYETLYHINIRKSRTRPYAT